ncbi:MAG: hypothetical protein BMS9Abin15_0260 [Gammaproteobacteria bacterium]|nr:MAG: hypothetical protein BMS9Abin15_0260 [Gammaproteobacteria bacterium]
MPGRTGRDYAVAANLPDKTPASLGIERVWLIITPSPDRDLGNSEPQAKLLGAHVDRGVRETLIFSEFPRYTTPWMEEIERRRRLKPKEVPPKSIPAGD